MSVMHTEQMFDQKTQAEAMILDDLHQKAAREQALLSGAPVPAGTGIVHHLGREFAEHEPRWVVPEICPGVRCPGRPVRGFDRRASEVRVLRPPAALPASSVMLTSVPGA